MEHLREYQDYLLGYRLRSLIGGRLVPTEPPLDLARYAQLRVERQELARLAVAGGDVAERLRRVDALTDRLNFGLWHNPSETVELLKAVVKAGGCRALENEDAFLDELFTRSERARMSEAEAQRLALYYLGLVRASAAYLDSEVFTRLRAAIEPLRETLPVVVLP